jgi:hypothetical protein
MVPANILLIALLAATTVQAFLPRPSSVKLSTFLSAKEAPAPEDETEDEMRVRMKAKARKMMYNENGVAYAPWVTRQINEEAIIEGLIMKEKGGTVKKKTSILDRGEIESSEGMKWRMSGDQVDLAWVTGLEDDNKGYIVEKRPSYGGDFQEIASFKEVAQLVSKGGSGGRLENCIQLAIFLFTLRCFLVLARYQSILFSTLTISLTLTLTTSLRLNHIPNSNPNPDSNPNSNSNLNPNIITFGVFDIKSSDKNPYSVSSKLILTSDVYYLRYISLLF